MSDELIGPLKMSPRAIRRCVEATGGNASQLGAIVLATFGMYPATLPAFGMSATITSDGYVLCDIRTRNGEYKSGAFVSSLQEIVDKFRRLADWLKLSDADRAALMDGLKRWCATDARMGEARKDIAAMLLKP